MANAYNTVSVATTATQIIALKNQRDGCIIFNNSSQIVYLGMDSSVTTSIGLPLLPNASLVNSGYNHLWRGDIWGIVAATTSDVRYFDWELT